MTGVKVGVSSTAGSDRSSADSGSVTDSVQDVECKNWLFAAHLMNS